MIVNNINILIKDYDNSKQTKVSNSSQEQKKLQQKPMIFILNSHKVNYENIKKAKELSDRIRNKILTKNKNKYSYNNVNIINNSFDQLKTNNDKFMPNNTEYSLERENNTIINTDISNLTKKSLQENKTYYSYQSNKCNDKQ